MTPSRKAETQAVPTCLIYIVEAYFHCQEAKSLKQPCQRTVSLAFFFFFIPKAFILTVASLINKKQERSSYLWDNVFSIKRSWLLRETNPFSSYLLPKKLSVHISNAHELTLGYAFTQFCCVQEKIWIVFLVKWCLLYGLNLLNSNEYWRLVGHVFCLIPATLALWGVEVGSWNWDPWVPIFYKIVRS